MFLVVNLLLYFDLMELLKFFDIVQVLHFLSLLLFRIDLLKSLVELFSLEYHAKDQHDKD